MAGVEGVGNLVRSGVRPLRSTAKAQDNNTSQTFSIEELKNGGSMDVSGTAKTAPPTPENYGPTRSSQPSTLRERYTRGTPASSARKTQNSRLSSAEQVEKLGKIRKSAVEYESVFVDQLVKQMRPSPMVKTPGGETFSEIAEQPFRDHLSQAGGLGLANSIVGQIARQEGLDEALAEHPEVMGPNYKAVIPKSVMRTSAGNLHMLDDDSQVGQTEAADYQGMAAIGRRSYPAPPPVDFEDFKTAGPEPNPQWEYRTQGFTDPPLNRAQKAIEPDNYFKAAPAAAPKTQSSGETSRPTGLMSSEEISYLYEESSDDWS